MAIGPAGVFHLAWFGLVLPLAAIHSGRRLPRVPFPPRARHFTAVIAQQCLFLALALAAARLERIELFPPFVLRPLALAIAGILVGAGLVVMLPRWRRRIAERERRLYLFMPRTAGECVLWAGVSMAAGVAEEIAYRGVMYALLLRLTGSPLVAALAAAVAFGAGHAVQGRHAAIAVVGVALVLQGLVALSGSLYVAIATHATYDLAAGLIHGHYGRTLGYPRDPLPPLVAAPASPAVPE